MIVSTLTAVASLVAFSVNALMVLLSSLDSSARVFKEWPFSRSSALESWLGSVKISAEGSEDTHQLDSPLHTEMQSFNFLPGQQ